MTRLSRLLWLVALCGCDTSSHRFDVVDQPEPVPEELDIEIKKGAEPTNAPDAELVKKCVPGTGKQEDGTCVALRTHDHQYVQRVQVPAGKFVMGDTPVKYDASKAREQPDTRWSGQPPRQLEIGGYWIDLHEVTREAYAACVGEGGCTPPRCEDADDPLADRDPDLTKTAPQTCVTHEQAEAFCKVKGARLPTETEWEYAARGPDARIYPWGNQLRDEYRAVLSPVVGGMVDRSYFGILGLGTNAREWVAEPFELDAALKSFVTKPFRSESGPLKKVMNKMPAAWVTKGGRAGSRRPDFAAAPDVGFRCAADLDDGVKALDLPAKASGVPLVVGGKSIEVFGGVAEAVNRAEAKRFCKALDVKAGGAALNDWRLPTLQEIKGNRAVFRGPGPFWTADGAAVQRSEGRAKKPDDPWEPETAKDSEALAARCVRG